MNATACLVRRYYRMAAAEPIFHAVEGGLLVLCMVHMQVSR